MKRGLIVLTLFLSVLSYGKPSGGKVAILSAATTTATGQSHRPNGAKRVFQCSGTTSAGSGAAAIVIEVGNDDSNWITAGTITLTLGTTATDDGFATDAPWHFVRARVSSISGTDASVSCVMGTE